VSNTYRNDIIWTKSVSISELTQNSRGFAIQHMIYNEHEIYLMVHKMDIIRGLVATRAAKSFAGSHFMSPPITRNPSKGDSHG
jgi:hypothetical protein